MEQKMNDPDFFRDTDAILSPDEIYDPHAAYEVVRRIILELL